MLVLSRKPGERVVIAGCITVKVLSVGRRVRLAIEAPENVPIRRGEIADLRIALELDPHPHDGLLLHLDLPPEDAP